MAWAKGSNRSKPLPQGWSKKRRRILKRDAERCVQTIHTPIRVEDVKDLAPGLHGAVVFPAGSRCPERATDVHHLFGVDDDGDHALVSLCRYHHGLVPSTGAGAPAENRRPKPVKRHPGLI